MATVTLLGIAQDGGVPQAGCSCPRCLAVHEGKSHELYPVALGIIDEDGGLHLVEASRALSRQLYLWSQTINTTNDKILLGGRKLSSLSITHLHLGHIDGIGQFGREVMGMAAGSVRLIASPSVIDDLGKKSYLYPFTPEYIKNNKKVTLGTGVSLEFVCVPHRNEEGSDMHGIIIAGKNQRIFFLPDHDTYQETLAFHQMSTLRQWFLSLSVDVVLLDGTFFTFEEIAGNRKDYTGIPHPPIVESVQLLGERNTDIDPEIVFVHMNHSNPILNDANKREQVQTLGWEIGKQGQVWNI